jgi:hypothetical protein
VAINTLLLGPVPKQQSTKQPFLAFFPPEPAVRRTDWISKNHRGVTARGIRIKKGDRLTELVVGCTGKRRAHDGGFPQRVLDTGSHDVQKTMRATFKCTKNTLLDQGARAREGRGPYFTWATTSAGEAVKRTSTT